MKKLVFLACLLAAAAGGYAQITLTLADFAQPGDTLWYSYDTINVSANLDASAGAGQTWNFGTAANHVKNPTWFMDPSSAPVSVPAGITHVMFEGNISAPTFMNVSATGVTTYQANPAAFLGGPAFLSLKSLTFPMQYQSTTTDSTKTVIEVDANNVGMGALFDSVRIMFNVHLHSVCDGWGELTTPTGTYHSLRLKNTIVITTKFEGKAQIVGWMPIPNSTLPFPVPARQEEISYMWIGTGSKYVLAQTNMVTDNGNMREDFYYQASPDISSGLAKYSKINMHASVYPNPASDQAQLSFSLSSAQLVTVRVYDITGREVSLQHAACQAGNNAVALELNNLPAGMYIARLNSEEGRGAARISVVK